MEREKKEWRSGDAGCPLRGAHPCRAREECEINDPLALNEVTVTGQNTSVHYMYFVKAPP